MLMTMRWFQTLAPLQAHPSWRLIRNSLNVQQNAAAHERTAQHYSREVERTAQHYSQEQLAPSAFLKQELSVLRMNQEEAHMCS